MRNKIAIVSQTKKDIDRMFFSGFKFNTFRKPEVATGGIL